MTRKELVTLMEKVFSKGLDAAIVIYRSPLTHRLEERHIYADNFAEVSIWATQMKEYYHSNSEAYGIWVNNICRFDHGQLIRKEDCYDE